MLGFQNVDPRPQRTNEYLAEFGGEPRLETPSRRRQRPHGKRDMDRLMREAGVRFRSKKKRKAAFDRVQEIVYEQAPFIYLINKNALFGGVLRRWEGAAPVILSPADLLERRTAYASFQCPGQPMSSAPEKPALGEGNGTFIRGKAPVLDGSRHRHCSGRSAGLGRAKAARARVRWRWAILGLLSRKRATVDGSNLLLSRARTCSKMREGAISAACVDARAEPGATESAVVAESCS